MNRRCRKVTHDRRNPSGDGLGSPDHGGDEIEAYLAQPLADGSFGAVVVIHHFPGYDEETKEITRRFADHGYLALCPNLYSRQAPGAGPEEAAAVVRALGGVPDEQLVGDVDGAATYLKAHRLLQRQGGDHRVLLGGAPVVPGRLQPAPRRRRRLLRRLRRGRRARGVTAQGRPRRRIWPATCRARLLGLFGAEDQNPSPEQTAELEAILTAQHKTFEFHTFDGAGHAFFATNRTNYRPEVAAAGWSKIWDFFGRYLSNAPGGA